MKIDTGVSEESAAFVF